MSATIWKGWAVVVKSQRSRWTHPQYMASTRGGAIISFDGTDEGHFAKLAKDGKARCVRVVLLTEDDT